MIRSAAAALMLLAVTAVAAESAPVTITLKERAAVGRVDVRLADIADVQASDGALRERLEQLRVAMISRDGAHRTIRREGLRAAVARFTDAPAIVWRGAARIVVQYQANEYRGAQLAETARQHLSRYLREQYPDLTRLDIRVTGEVPDVRAPGGEIAVAPRPIRSSRVSKRVCVWVDIRANGAAYRSVPVWLSVEGYAAALVAKRAIKPREKIALRDLATEERDIVGLHPGSIAKPDDVANQRARTFIPAGAIVQTKNLEPNPPVEAQALVDVRVTAGAIVIETRAVAEQDGYVGDFVRVRNPKTELIFNARVVGDGMVAVTER